MVEPERKPDLSDANKERRIEAARLMGSANTERKRESSRQNVKKAMEAFKQKHPLKPLSSFACTCGAGDSLEHKYNCPRYKVIYQRKRRGLPLE
ncbi:MAG TPA: hypothetical protein VKU00_07555 [Chthonomonadaceae bacterium]|nr:hypothetical protein [Chthonomonadaceae bacterium]